MRDWFKKNNVLIKLLSVLIAVGLWFFVLSVDNPERNVDKRDIEVSLIGEDVLKSQNLAIADKNAPEIDLKLSGTLSRLGDVEESNIIVRSDVSKITKPGTYELPYDVSVIDGVTIVSRSPGKITVTVEEIQTVELPIQVNIIGDLAENLETDKAIVDPLNVRVRGIESEVKSAAYAVINIDADTISDTFLGDVTYTIVDVSGKELKSAALEKLDKTVNLNIPVYMSKEIELAVDLIDAPGVPASDAKVEIDPPVITVIGEVANVTDLDRVVLGTVDLNSFLQNHSSIMDVVLPENVSSKDDISVVYVRVSLPETDTMLVPVENIKLINVPYGFDAIVETVSVVVTLRGENETLRSLDHDSISLVVDMKHRTPKIGRDLYPATVTFDQSYDSIGVYGSYNVIVNSAVKTIDVETGEIPADEKPDQVSTAGE